MLVNPWTPAVPQPQLLVERVRGLAGQSGGPGKSRVGCGGAALGLSLQLPPALHPTRDVAQPRLLWAEDPGHLGCGGAERWPLPFPPPSCPHSRDEDQKG